MVTEYRASRNRRVEDFGSMDRSEGDGYRTDRGGKGGDGVGKGKKKGRIVRIAVVDKVSDVRSEERVTMTEGERIWA